MPRKRSRRGVADYISAFTLFAIVAVAAAWLQHQNREVVTNVVTAVDGDSLRSGDLDIRLVGIDAPEFNQTCRKNQDPYQCGRRSHAFLKELLASSGEATCFGEGHDKFGRLLAECFVEETNLNAAMVASGWAISFGGYERQEANAKHNGLGLWAGEFDTPRDWRAKNAGLIEVEHSLMFRGLWRRFSNWLKRGGDE